MRIDERLDPRDEAWLEAHFLRCDPCSRVAAEYDAESALFAPARGAYPDPPRDLWARTAGAIEAQHARRRPSGLGALFGRRAGTGQHSVFAPLAGAMVVAIAVGLGLLNGLPAKESTSKGPDPDATPFPLVAGEVQVIGRNEDGRLEIRRQPVDEVCPLGASSCAVAEQSDSTDTELATKAASWDAIISPSQDQVVVVERGDGAQGVYVLSVAGTTAVDPTSEPLASVPAPTADSGSEPPSEAPAVTASPEPTGEGVPSDEPSEEPGGSAEPLVSAVPTDAPASPTEPSASADPTPTEAVASVDPSPSPTPTPIEPTTGPSASVEVTPLPGGAIEIARDVLVVGTTAAYSPDGSRFAFTARPAQGDDGPDVYVWTVGQARANAVTTDHASVFAGWTGDRLLVSRIHGEEPRSVELRLDDETAHLVLDGRMWRPTVGPDGRTGVWWDGTIRPAEDGRAWLPRDGELVLDAWPARGNARQILASRGLADWAVRWDESGKLLAVWTTTAGPDEPGVLSLYTIDPDTGRADLDHPKLDKAPAFEGFSLRDERMTWSAPAEGGDTTVQVLAWDGDTFGRFELLTEDGATVIR